LNSTNYLNSLFNLTGKIALVTGGGTGIGLIIAEALATAGARVVIVSRKKLSLEKAIAHISSKSPEGSVEGFTGDLSSEIGIANLVDEFQNRSLQLNILVNNAGVSWGADLTTFPYDAWDRVFSVNVSGLFYLSQKLLTNLEAAASSKNPSKIINIGSVMGTEPYGDGAYSYSASKASVHHLTKILAKELAKKHVTVNAFAPGPFESKMTSFATNTKAKREAVAMGIPLRRIGIPIDIAASTLWLCGPGGNYITGAIIPIDGGIHISTGPELFSGSKKL